MEGSNKKNTLTNNLDKLFSAWVIKNSNFNPETNVLTVSCHCLDNLLSLNYDYFDYDNCYTVLLDKCILTEYQISTTHSSIRKIIFDSCILNDEAKLYLMKGISLRYIVFKNMIFKSDTLIDGYRIYNLTAFTETVIFERCQFIGFNDEETLRLTSRSNLQFIDCTTKLKK